MKKGKIALILSLLAMVCVFAACNLISVYKIEITEMPKTVYKQGTTETAKLTISADVGTGTPTIIPFEMDYQGTIQNNTYGIVVTGFDLTQNPGTYTATISYQGAQVSFMYQIITSAEKFSGGNGTKETPYLISTVEDWNDINEEGKTNSTYTYYKLTNDIDFGDRPAQMIEKFYGEITGANGADKNFTITVKSVVNNIDEYESGRNCIFYRTIGVISNLNVYFNNAATSLVAYMDANGTKDDKNIKFDDEHNGLTIENVNTYGVIIPNDSTGVFANRIGGYGQSATSFTLKNCTNNAHVKGAGVRAIGFVYNLNNSEPTDSKLTDKNVTIEKCTNNGTIIGNRASAFIDQKYIGGFVDCVNNGDIKGSNVAQLSCGENVDGIDNKGSLIKIKELTNIFKSDTVGSNIELTNIPENASQLFFSITMTEFPTIGGPGGTISYSQTIKANQIEDFNKNGNNDNNNGPFKFTKIVNVENPNNINGKIQWDGTAWELNHKDWKPGSGVYNKIYYRVFIYDARNEIIGYQEVEIDNTKE